MKTLNLDTITKLTRNGNYEVEYPIEDIPYTIEKYTNKFNLDMNPDFQRGHVWTEDQQIKFIEFLLKGGETQAIRFNHASWMNFSTNDQMVLVDGLQRTTAILKFMKNELPVFGGFFKNEIENLRLYNINIKINVNNLKTKKEVLQWYIDINSGGTPHTEEEITKVKQMID